MSILACSGFEEGPGANFTPPTLGNFMEKQKNDNKRLREAKAGALVTREGRQFHERQAKRFGVHTSRGLAHFKASKMYTREGNRLQEMFEKSGGQGQLPPKAIMKASKAAMLFHKKCAEKAGLDSDLGHAHVAQMEHHADMFKKAKGQHQQAGQQQGMGEAGEGGPGSGPQNGPRGPVGRGMGKQPYGRPSGGSPRKAPPPESDSIPYNPHQNQRDKDKAADKKELTPENYKKKYGENSEANMGHSGKQSPVPVPKKSEQPSDDIRQNKPPIKVKQESAEGAEGGPGSGPRGGRKTMGERHEKALNAFSKDAAHGKHGDAGAGAIEHYIDKYKLNNAEANSARNYAKFVYKSHKSGKESGRGPDNSMSNTFPSKVSKQVKDELVFRGKKQKMFDPRMNRDKSMKRSKESRQDEDAPKQIDLRDFYKQEEKGTGWKNSNVYSPTKLRENQQASNVVIKEF